MQADETYMGGVKEGKRGRGAEGKSIVFGMLVKEGDIVAEVVDNVKKSTLQPIIEINVKKGSHIHTDELLSCRGLDKAGYSHNTVSHGACEYVKGDCHVNELEGF